MDTLDLRGPSELRPTGLTAQPVQKDATVAFLVSLLLPGAGQVYCGEKGRGLWTFLFFAIGIGLVVSLMGALSGTDETAGLFWGLGLRTALVLYVFSFLDAYFTAREMSDGTYSLMQYNPRVAAVLNLLTRGFGYWYLDEKQKGILLFIAVGIADRASRGIKDGTTSDLLGVFVELALAGMAVHAFRLANQKNRRWLDAPQAATAAPILPSSGLNPGIPLALAGILALGYVSLVSLGVMMPDDKIDQAAAVVTNAETGGSYVNRKHGIELHVPAGWALSTQDVDSVVEAEAHEGACSVSLMREVVLPFLATESFGDDLIREIQSANPGFRVQARKPGQLGALAAHEVVFTTEVEGTEVRQDYVLARQGFFFYALVFTTAEPLAEACAPDTKSIRNRVVVPN